MSKLIFSTDDFYYHPEIEEFGMYDKIYDKVIEQGLDTEDITRDDEFIENAINHISHQLYEYLKDEEEIACIALIGTGTNWRGTFSGGRTIDIDVDTIREGIFEGNWDTLTITYEDNDPIALFHYSDHDWNSYMNLEVIFKGHLPKKMVEEIEGGLYDEEEVMGYLLRNPRKEPVYLTYDVLMRE